MTSILDKMIAKEKSFRHKRFFAPFTPNTKTAVVKLDGMNYVFKINCPGTGFGFFQSLDGVKADLIEMSSLDSVRQYLDILPRIHLILCYETNYGWVAYPLHLESAKKKLSVSGPIIVRSVADCQRFDVIVARFDGLYFWYDEIFSGEDPFKSEEIRQCFTGFQSKPMFQKFEKLSGVSPERKTAFEIAVGSWEEFRKTTTEENLQNLLVQGGGSLKSYIVRGDNLEVNWDTSSGSRYISIVDKETFDVLSAGICLSGEDTKFHLKDLPYIVFQGEQQQAIYRTIHTSIQDGEDDDD